MGLPFNCQVRFVPITYVTNSEGDRVAESGAHTVKSRACFSRPRNIFSDDAVEVDQTRDWAHLRIGVIDLVPTADALRVEITPDGSADVAIWDVDRVNQDVSVGGRIVSRKLNISRVTSGLTG